MKKGYTQKISSFVLVFILTSVFTQGAFLNSGQSGFGIEGAFSPGDAMNGISCGVGYSAQGVVDFGFTFARSSNNPQFSGEKATVTGIGFSMGMFAIKQNRRIPFSLSSFVSYEHVTLNSEGLHERRWSANSYVWGAAVNHNFVVSPEMSLQPGLTLGYLFGTLDDGFLWGIGFDIVCRVNEKILFALGPGVSMNNDQTSISVIANLIFPIKQSPRQSSRHKVYTGR
jgi:hypothetical protein